MIFKVDESFLNKRLDVVVSELTGISRSAAQKLIESGAVTVNGKATEKKYQVKTGDEIDVTLPEAEEYEAVAEDIPLSVVYEHLPFYSKH